MNDIRLTKRGKIVVAILAAVVAYLAVSAAFDAITPDNCKVSPQYMSKGCIDLIYK